MKSTVFHFNHKFLVILLVTFSLRNDRSTEANFFRLQWRLLRLGVMSCGPVSLLSYNSDGAKGHQETSLLGNSDVSWWPFECSKLSCSMKGLFGDALHCSIYKWKLKMWKYRTLLVLGLPCRSTCKCAKEERKIRRALPYPAWIGSLLILEK